MKDTAAATRMAVLERIPPGTAITDAASIMRWQGFACQRRTDSGFVEQPERGGADSFHPPTDHLSCDSGEWGIMARRWQVIITAQGGATTGVFVNFGMTGP